MLSHISESAKGGKPVLHELCKSRLFLHWDCLCLVQIVKGSDAVEIITAPVIQVSLSLAVSVDDFFDIGDLINNIAFVLNIDRSRIRVVK